MTAPGSAEPIAAIILAAGESRRMGDTNKLSLDIAGQPLLRHAVNTLLAARVSEVLVVLGHEADWAATIIGDLPVRTITNADYRAGQASSVALGLSAIGEGHAGILMCLADQPALTAEDLNRLIDAFMRSSEQPILVPRYRGQRGNPALLAGHLRKDILGKSGSPGCRAFMDENPGLVAFWDAPNDHFTRDIDTRDDYHLFIHGTCPR